MFCTFMVVVCERKGRLFSFDFEDRDINVSIETALYQYNHAKETFKGYT